MSAAPRFSGCGIVGSVLCETTDQVLRAMTDTLAHRGPDGAGAWTSPDGAVRLGHRRLAIVGPDGRGAQPMSDGVLTVTCNGEIYNYFELRRKLEEHGRRFTSDCDTEVLLHGYAVWGPDVVERLVGMFAFALHDSERRRLLLARDPLGVKPFVHTTVGTAGLLFASEPKALLAHPGVSRRPNLDAIRADVILENFGPKEETWFAGISNLEPGTFMLVDVASGERRVQRYWRPPSESLALSSVQEYADLVRTELQAAMKRQILSDVGFCVTNSGGVDSAAVTAIASRLTERDLDAFTVCYDGSPEPPDLAAPDSALRGAPADTVDRWHALRMASGLRGVRTHTVKLRAEEMLSRSSIDSVIRALDGGPPLDMRILSVAELYAAIGRAGHKVVLTGEGADEIWLGYYHVPYHEFWRLPPERLSLDYLADEYFPRRVILGYPAWNESFLDERRARELSRRHLERNYRSFETDDPLNRLTYFAMRTHLQTLLNVVDKMSMRSSVEARVPWVDPRLVELSFRIPGYVKLTSDDDNRAKALNRRALRGIVPSHILDREKAQFPSPPRAFHVGPIERLVREDAPAMRRSDFLRGLFAPELLERLGAESGLDGPQLFAIYAMWRFGELYVR